MVGSGGGGLAVGWANALGRRWLKVWVIGARRGCLKSEIASGKEGVGLVQAPTGVSRGHSAGEAGREARTGPTGGVLGRVPDADRVRRFRCPPTGRWSDPTSDGTFRGWFVPGMARSGPCVPFLSRLRSSHVSDPLTSQRGPAMQVGLVGPRWPSPPRCCRPGSWPDGPRFTPVALQPTRSHPRGRPCGRSNDTTSRNIASGRGTSFGLRESRSRRLIGGPHMLPRCLPPGERTTTPRPPPLAP